MDVSLHAWKHHNPLSKGSRHAACELTTDYLCYISQAALAVAAVAAGVFIYKAVRDDDNDLERSGRNAKGDAKGAANDAKGNVKGAWKEAKGNVKGAFNS